MTEERLAHIAELDRLIKKEKDPSMKRLYKAARHGLLYANESNTATFLNKLNNANPPRSA